MSETFTQHDLLTDSHTDTVEELLDLKQLIVYNDDVNTFDWVIESLIEICSHTHEQAEQLSIIIHFKGKASVKEDILEKLHPMQLALTDRGIDATIE